MNPKDKDLRAAPTESPRLTGRAPLLIVLGALLLRLVFCFLIYPRVSARLHWQGIDDGFDQLAVNLLHGYGFTFDPSAPPNLTTPPGYAFFLAAIYKLTGISMNEGWRVWISQSLLDTATTFLIMLVTLRLYGSRRAALVAGALYAVYPQIIAYCARPFGEVLVTFVLLVATTVAIEAEASLGRMPALVAGVLYGLAALVKEKILLFPLVLAAAILWRKRKQPGRAAAAAALLLVGTLVAVGPWLARGYELTGKLVPITSRSGRALHWGLRSDYGVADPDVNTLPPAGTRPEERWGMVLPARPDDPTMSEARQRLEGDEALLGTSLKVVRERPGYFLRMIPVKLFAFWYWGQPGVIWFNFATQIPLIVLGAWGVILARDRGRLVVPVLLVLYFAGIHAILVARMRYSLPVMPYVIMFAGYTLSRMTERPEPREARTAPKRLPAGSLAPGG